MALNQTMEVLAPRDEDIPVSAPSGGSITVDYAQQINLLTNRISALETAFLEFQRPEPTKAKPEPEPEPEIETETPDTEKENDE